VAVAAAAIAAKGSRGLDAASGCEVLLEALQRERERESTGKVYQVLLVCGVN
jgi:hypothetical protein